jgi:hypothetical protein
MAILKNTNIDDVNFLRLPAGTTAERPADPQAGMTRFNTTTNTSEFYTGTTWKVDDLGSPRNPATSATQLYNDNPNIQSGIYYIKNPAGYIFPVYCKFDASGGWMNVNITWGPYGNIISGGTLSGGSGGGNMLGGVRGDATQPINGQIITNNQGNVYGCPGQPHRSVVQLTSIGQSMRDDFNITQCRVSAHIISNTGNVVCGYLGTTDWNDRVLYNGSTAAMFSVCANTPNRWSDQNPSRFLYDASGTLNSNRLWSNYTACAGNYRVRLLELFVR